MKNNNIFKKYIKLLNIFGCGVANGIYISPSPDRVAYHFFEYSRAMFSGSGIMLYVAPLLDLFLNYSLQSMICWMR